MRIQRLDITGFKSFTDRSVFSFAEGITGIVGPNGCGKSNVVDAVRWVMGEQSAKNLRGRGMEDVIFSGSESKPALSMAEVSSTMRIEEGDSLAPQYAGLSEITVTRRLFRSGESEYLINKTQCRLLDVTELFLGTGVGTRAYSIIEQGSWTYRLRQTRRPAGVHRRSRRGDQIQGAPENRRAKNGVHAAKLIEDQRHRLRAGEAARVIGPAGQKGGQIQEDQSSTARNRAARGVAPLPRASRPSEGTSDQA